MKAFYGKSLPSEFLQAMVDGLEAADKNPKQRVSMGTYGRVTPDDVCVGCAATWALQNLIGRELEADEVRALGAWATSDLFEEDTERINRFEFAMERARNGDLSELARFCCQPFSQLTPRQSRWVLDTRDWDCGLPTVRVAIEEMQAAGL